MRSKSALKRKIEADPKFGSLVIAKFINTLMFGGKKTVAEQIVYKSLEIIRQKTKENPLDVFDRALKNVTPVLEVKSRRIGGANYQVPIEVRGSRKYALAFRWLIDAAREKKGKPMREKLAEELIEAASNQGAAVKKKENVHRMAEANRAFAHFA